MTKDEALKLALEALVCLKKDFDADQFEWEIADEAITAIKEAMAQPEQEPVEFEEWHKENYMQSLEKYGEIYKNNHVRCRHQGWLGAQSLSPQRTWVGLTDEEIQTEWVLTPQNDKAEGIWFGRRIEAKIKEKNG